MACIPSRPEIADKNLRMLEKEGGGLACRGICASLCVLICECECVVGLERGGTKKGHNRKVSTIYEIPGYIFLSVHRFVTAWGEGRKGLVDRHLHTHTITTQHTVACIARGFVFTVSFLYLFLRLVALENEVRYKYSFIRCRGERGRKE